MFPTLSPLLALATAIGLSLVPRPSDATDGFSFRGLLELSAKHVYRPKRSGRAPLRRVVTVTRTGRAHADYGEANEDAHGQVRAIAGRLFLVCDGMGNHEDGDWASRRLVQLFKSNVRWAKGKPKEVLTEAALAAHSRLRLESSERAERRGYDSRERPGSTIGALLVDPDSDYLTVTWVGDPSLKVYHDGKLESIITRPHTLAQRMVDAGELTPEQVRKRADRNQLWQAMGFSERVAPGTKAFCVEPNSVALLSTDGQQHVDDETQKAIIEQHWGSTGAMARALVERARVAGADDVTLKLLEFGR